MPAALPRPEIRLHPGAGAAFVQAIYRDVVIASRCLVAGTRGRFVIGAGPGVDAPAPAETDHLLVSSDERGFTVALAPGMTGTVLYEDRTVPLGQEDVVLTPQGRLRIGFGALAFLVSASAIPPIIPRPRRRLRDHWAALAAGA